MSLLLAALVTMAQTTPRDEVISDTELGFTLTLPKAFVRETDIQIFGPDVAYALIMPASERDGTYFVLIIERMRRTLGPERVAEDKPGRISSVP